MPEARTNLTPTKTDAEATAVDSGAGEWSQYCELTSHQL